MTRLRRKRQTLWVALSALALMGFVAAGIMNPTNIAQTRPNHEDVLLRTRYYKASLPQVRQAVEDSITHLRTYGRRWRLVASKAAPHSATIQATVPVLIFTDDLIVTLRPERDEVAIDVRSASRVGKGDFGENRRHILQLLAMLDEKLKLRAG